MHKLIIMRTSAGEKLAIVEAEDDFSVWLRKWRRNSNRWTRLQKVARRNLNVVDPRPSRQHRLVQAAVRAKAFGEPMP